jgi:hypothetical protein
MKLFKKNKIFIIIVIICIMTFIGISIYYLTKDTERYDEYYIELFYKYQDTFYELKDKLIQISNIQVISNHRRPYAIYKYDKVKVSELDVDERLKELLLFAIKKLDVTGIYKNDDFVEFSFAIGDIHYSIAYIINIDNTYFSGMDPLVDNWYLAYIYAE